MRLVFFRAARPNTGCAVWLLLAASLLFSNMGFSSNPLSGGCGFDSVTVQPPVCYNSCNGSIDVFAFGSGQLSYAWNNIPGSDSSFVSALCAGVYTVTITDSVGCIAVDTIILENPDSISFTIETNPSSCPGGCSGSAEVIPGDTLPFTYQWPGFINTGPVLQNVCPGIYDVIITINNGCSVLVSAEVEYLNPFQLNFISQPASCLTSCDGVATVVANGTGPFDYLWATGPIQTNQTAFNLCSGVYTVDVTDSIGCVVTDSIVINIASPPDVFAVAQSPVCFGGCDGTAEIVTDTTLAYNYEWFTSPPQYNQTATGLCAGTYYYSVVDIQNGCTIVDSVVISDPDPAQFNFDVTPSFCENTCTGSVSVTTNAPAPYTYLWSTGSLSDSDSLLCPGIYSVTVTDSVGCASTGSVEINAQPLTLFTAGATCFNICDGTAGLYLPFQGAWSIVWNSDPLLNDTAIVNLCAGINIVEIIDSSGCMLSGQVLVSASQPVVSTAIINPVTCIGYCDGEIALEITGNAPFLYEWNTNPVQYSSTIDSLCEGTYIVLITDSIGCSVYDTLSVTAPQKVVPNFITQSNSCFGICDGTAQVVIAAPGNYLTEWQTNPVQTGLFADSLCPGFTAIHITDSNGCVTIDSAFVIGTFPINVNINSTGISCYGLCDGFASGQVWGGTPGYSYEWSNGFQTQQTMNLCPGIYTVTVTDVSGCTGMNSVTVTEPDELNFSFNVTSASCSGCNDGMIELFPTGGTAPYFYVWNPGGIGGSVSDSLVSGWYNVCVLDDHSCVICNDIFVSFFSSVSQINYENTNATVWPNPFINQGSIILSNSIKTDLEHCILQVFDINSKICDKIVAGKIAGEGFMLDGSAAVPGVYFYRILLRGKSIQQGKFIVAEP